MESKFDREIKTRRVELPHWLSSAVLRCVDPLKTVMEASYPEGEIHESRGHIFMRQPRNLFDGPAVGLDMDVYDRLMDEPTIKEVKFYVYSIGYQLVAIWAVSAVDFIDKAKMVQTKPQFAPQMMVPLSALNNCRIPSFH